MSGKNRSYRFFTGPVICIMKIGEPITTASAALTFCSASRTSSLMTQSSFMRQAKQLWHAMNFILNSV